MIFGELGAFCLFLGLVFLFGAYRLLRAHVEFTRTAPGFDPVRRSLLLVALALGAISLGLGFFAGNQVRLAWRIHDLRTAMLAQAAVAKAAPVVPETTVVAAANTTLSTTVNDSTATDAKPAEAATPAAPPENEAPAAPSGAQYVVAISEGSALLRASPAGKRIGSAANGRRVVAVDPKPRAWNGRDWLHVRVLGQADGEGWIAYENLKPAPPDKK